MKYFLHFTFVCIISINSCVQSNQNKTTTTRPADYTSAKKADTSFSSTQKNVDSLHEKNNSQQENKSSNSIEEKYFELLNATSEDWISGIAGGNRGTEYYFKIKITSNAKLEFDTAWINKNAFSIFISKEQKAVTSQPIKFSNGDTITLRISDIHSTQQQNKNVASPIKYEGAALFSYSVNGMKKYFVVTEIKKQKSVNRP